MHRTIEATPAMAAGLADHQYTMDWVVGLMDAKAPKPGPRGACRQADSNLTPHSNRGTAEIKTEYGGQLCLWYNRRVGMKGFLGLSTRNTS